MNNDKKVIVLAGATGDLGSLIANELLKLSNTELRLIVRPESVDRVSSLEAAGAKAYPIDLSSQEYNSLLDEALSGAYTVISAVQGGPDIMINAQLRLLQKASDKGVRRFIPSSFSYNIFGLDSGDNLNTDVLRAFADEAEKIKEDTEVVHILIGAFLDRKILFGFLGAFDLERKRAFLWGDGNAYMDFTTYEDTARYTASAAIDDAALPSTLEFSGDTLSFHELIRAYEDASETTIDVDKKGSLADLQETILELKNKEPNNVFAWLPLMYWYAMLSGKGKLQSLSNRRYPSISPLTVFDYVKREGL